MKSVPYADLLTVPYKDKGRGIDGLDCYGLVLEMCRRADTPLLDLVFDSLKTATDENGNARAYINLREIPKEKARAGTIVQCEDNDILHIGYMLDKIRVLHMTGAGAKVTPIQALKNIVFFEVVK